MLADPGCFSIVFIEETCTWRLLIDYECLCAFCSGIGPG